MAASGSLLQIVQDAALELGLTAPLAVATATDQQSLQLNALANRIGRILMQSADWSHLTRLFQITMATPTTTTGNVTLGSAIITGIPSTAAITPATYFALSGSGIQTGARVATVDSATQISMNVPASGTYAATTVVFAQDTFALPADWNNPTPRSQWDRTNRWELQGAISPQEYQFLPRWTRMLDPSTRSTT